jgi:hypothetical protein
MEHLFEQVLKESSESYEDYFALFGSGSDENDFWHGTDVQTLMYRMGRNFGAWGPEQKDLSPQEFLDWMESHDGGTIRVWGSNLHRSGHGDSTILRRII